MKEVIMTIVKLLKILIALSASFVLLQIVNVMLAFTILKRLS